MEALQQCNLTFHHVGCVTRSIENSKGIYTGPLGFANVSETFFISSQKVKVCFIEVGPGSYIELVEATEENDFFANLLKGKTPFYHTGYLTDDFEGTIQHLLANRFHILNRFNSEAFGGRQCAFLYTREMQLIEIIENTPKANAV